MVFDTRKHKSACLRYQEVFVSVESLKIDTSPPTTDSMNARHIIAFGGWRMVSLFVLNWIAFLFVLSFVWDEFFVLERRFFWGRTGFRV